MAEIEAIQQALREGQIDGWLMYDFRGSNPLARRVLGLDGIKPGSRRFFYLIPAAGEPIKIVHAIEAAALDHLPGRKLVYFRWQELEASVQKAIGDHRRLAMEYSPRNANPYIARVDAGTIELVRSFGVEVVPSGDLIQRFEAVWDDNQWSMHQEAAEIARTAFNVAFGLIADRVRHEGSVLESTVQAAIMDHFQTHGAITDSGPTVAVGPHSGDAHYSVTPASDAPIHKGDFVLIDLWCKLDRPKAVYADYTRCGFVGAEVPEKYESLFNVAVRARDAGLNLVRDSFQAGRSLRGGEVDEATRAVIDQAGRGDFFTHRTGHNIGQMTHGNGAHIDNLETRDERLIIPRTCFSIEPGIYLSEFGVRTEIDVYITKEGNVIVTGGDPQTCVLPILT